MTNQTPNTKPRRRWYQFSLRTLLIVVTVSAVPLGWVGWKLEQGRRERAVIAWVEKMGGNVWFDDVYSFDVGEKSRWKEWVEAVFGPKVRIVTLGETKVSDLSPLTELKSLKYLWIENMQLSDLSPLADFKGLEWLHLHNTPVSDVSPLAQLKNLELLLLQNTQVSDEQVQKLSQALPNCEIHHSTRVEK